MDEALKIAVQNSPILLGFIAALVAFSRGWLRTGRECDASAAERDEYKALVFELTGVSKQLTRVTAVATHAVVNGDGPKTKRRATPARRR